MAAFQPVGQSDVPAPSGGARGACGFSVYVLATSDKGTHAALAAAKRYADGLEAHVVLVVPHIAPYPSAMQDSAAPATARLANFRTAAEAMGLRAHIIGMMCRSDDEVPPAAMPRDAVVLVGGARRWWRSRHERLAARLAKSGYRALFVPTPPR